MLATVAAAALLRLVALVSHLYPKSIVIEATCILEGAKHKETDEPFNNEEELSENSIVRTKFELGTLVNEEL